MQTNNKSFFDTSINKDKKNKILHTGQRKKQGTPSFAIRYED
jgi:hypothetical protein